MCCGSSTATSFVATDGSVVTPEAAAADSNEYDVFYLNGTKERVTGIEEVRRRILDPASRAEGTDREGFQGGTYERV